MLLKELTNTSPYAELMARDRAERKLQQRNNKPYINSLADAERLHAARNKPVDQAAVNKQKMADRQLRLDAKFVGTRHNLEQWIMQVQRLVANQTLKFTPELKQAVKTAYMRSGGLRVESFSTMNATAKSLNEPEQAPGLPVQGNRASAMLVQWLTGMLNSGVFESNYKIRLFFKNLWMRMGGVKAESLTFMQSLLGD